MTETVTETEPKKATKAVKLTYSDEDCQKALDNRENLKWCTAYVTIEFVTAIIGSQPATKSGVVAFVQHHLGLSGEKATAAVKRILEEEVRKDEQTNANSEDEIPERESYQVNCLRRTRDGTAFVGTWMIRACLKAAASRLDLFKKKIGAKGDLAELAVIAPDGASNVGHLQQCIILGPDREAFKERLYEQFMGNVNGPQGRKSIVHDSEYAPIGSRVSFRVTWPSRKITMKDMIAALGAARNIGLGSVKAMECGRFKIIECRMERDAHTTDA